MEPSLPRVAITYCTQCKWMLRAAYFGQELLSTFGTTIGEIALIPATGGVFTVSLSYKPAQAEGEDKVEAKTVLLWDRKEEGGFPETKVLKQRVRDHLDPKRDLGHSDVHGKKKKESSESEDGPAPAPPADKPAAEQEGQEAIPSSDPRAVYVEVPTRGGGMTVIKPDGTVCEDC